MSRHEVAHGDDGASSGIQIFLPQRRMQMPVGEMQISPETSTPFDLHFIDVMVSPHQAATDMAKVSATS